MCQWKIVVLRSFLKKVRGMIVKYRISSKAKTFLLTLFEKRLPGYVITRWYRV